MCPVECRDFGIVSDPLCIRSPLFCCNAAVINATSLRLASHVAQSVEAGRYCDAGVSSALFLTEDGPDTTSTKAIGKEAITDS